MSEKSNNSKRKLDSLSVVTELEVAPAAPAPAASVIVPTAVPSKRSLRQRGKGAAIRYKDTDDKVSASAVTSSSNTAGTVAAPPTVAAAGTRKPARGSSISSTEASAIPDGKSKDDNGANNNSKHENGGANDNSNDNNENDEEVVGLHIRLDPLPPAPSPDDDRTMKPLTPLEQTQLEAALEFGDTNVDIDADHWRDDWSGNLAYADKEISNPATRSKGKGAGAKQQQSFQQSLVVWAHKTSSSSNSSNSSSKSGAACNSRLLANLIRHVYHMTGTPDAAQRILANANLQSVVSMERAIRRTCFDPTVLRQDGWTTQKSTSHVGATGGPFLIGDHIRWEGSDAVVISYVHDPEIGDLWKAIWIEGVDDAVGSYETFDLEAEELMEAKRKWERRQQKVVVTAAAATAAATTTGTGTSDTSSRRSARYNVSSDFTVKGIQDGIVLAMSYSKGARPGVYWPARVLHASEATGPLSQGKRSTSKQKVEVVFLAPYWDANEQAARSRRVGSLSEASQSAFNSGPLLHWETVDATDEMIKEYPYDGQEGLDIYQLRMAFRFTGLPKAAFPRYLDSNRLAMGLKVFAKRHLKTKVTATDRASAGLFETHPLAVQAPVFPHVVLHLPLSFILSQLPRPTDFSRGSSDNEKSTVELVLQLGSIVDAMKPPSCWGLGTESHSVPDTITPQVLNGSSCHQQPPSTPGVWLSSFKEENGKYPPLELDHFVNDLLPLVELFNRSSASPPIAALLTNVTRLLSQVSEIKLNLSELSASDRREKLGCLVRSWIIVKTHGEDAVSSVDGAQKGTLAVADWRRASERIYKYMTAILSDEGFGNGVSTVLTDSRCNGHVTLDGCFERAVRLPAALKGAKLAGAGASAATQLVKEIPAHYHDFVEQKLLIKAHSASYLKRMKSRCAAARTDSEGIVLTDDSDGNGGVDTRGSRGTWPAAVAAVATAVAAVDMIMKGECVNSFCVTRPPGHHAGRSLHAMKAVSNGFCVLNTVACAAIYATTPVVEGGLGLSRVCVIDFDVHHGNGTQDILCSTYDPRFLYVSIHAGGAEVNGAPMEDDPEHELHDLGSNPKQSGIYPGRCGDVSPHMGVLNIPLGPKVTSHAVGSAVITHINPAVDAFAPDLIILSAGFDAHKSDPMCLGALTAQDFGHITEVACELAFKSCSGRVLSVLEGGYGVPCCRPQKDLFLPPATPATDTEETYTVSQESKAVESTLIPESQGTIVSSPPPPTQPRPQPSKLLDLGDDLPSDMDDQVPYGLQRRLEKCHTEGFVDCVREHVKSLARCNKRK